MALFDRFSRLRTRGGKGDDEGRTKGDRGSGGVSSCVAGRASAQDKPIAATDQPETIIVLHVANYAALSRPVLDGAGLASRRMTSAPAITWRLSLVWFSGCLEGKFMRPP